MIIQIKPIIVIFFFIVYIISAKRLTISRIENRVNFIQKEFVTENEELKFKIFLKQRNLDLLENKFWEVSNPKSEIYGKFMSLEEINLLVSPSNEDVKTVVNWLKSNHIIKEEMMIHSDFIQLRINVMKASNLFETEFAYYQSIRNSLDQRIRIVESASIPKYLKNKIDFILGLSDFIEDYKFYETMFKSRIDVKDSFVTITPSFIKSYYGIPLNQVGENENNSISVASFNDFYSAGALGYFDSEYDIDSSSIRVNNSGPNCFGLNYCGQAESDLDIQYITAIGNNISTLFLSSGNGEWVLDWASSIQLFNPIPKIASISYSWAELEQCQATSFCPTLGIDSQIYIQRSNIEFQKIGLRGTTIFVSSGDDGSTSFYSTSGNCPIDGVNHYCPLGGCNHTITQCPSLTIIQSNGSLAIFPNGIGANTGILFSNQSFVDAVNEFIKTNWQCDLSIEEDISQNPHLYSSCSCENLIPTSNDELGIKIIGYSFDENAGSLFSPQYPTSSPYVTSVGATQIITNQPDEIVCSSSTGAAVTSGGGFALTQSQPYYQAVAVAKYLEIAENLPPSFSFDPTKRAYPDISLVAHKYSIGYSANDSSLDSCPCGLMNVDGTSASTPTVAGIFALINDKLLSAGKSQLGFLNPLLYQAAQEQPNVFNDIVTGNINCNRAYCCQYGFSAAVGYDPATGLGSINFPNMEQYILNIK
ncbi:hypothetical protein ACTFIW_011407 [Dictyostelium discoideum]